MASPQKWRVVRDSWESTQNQVLRLWSYPCREVPVKTLREGPATTDGRMAFTQKEPNFQALAMELVGDGTQRPKHLLQIISGALRGAYYFGKEAAQPTEG